MQNGESDSAQYPGGSRVEEEKEEATDLDDQHYGNEPGPKPAGSCRLGGQNFGGLCESTPGIKTKAVKDHVTEMEYDVFCIPEANTYWPKLDLEFQFNARFQPAWDSVSTCVAYNRKQKPPHLKQWGGTAMLSRGTISHRIKGKGRDEFGLGRWAWMRFQGNAGTALRIITGYRPNVKSDDGSLTVHAQHKRALNKVGDNRSPQDAWNLDFCHVLDKWLAKGEEIALVIDANDDIRDSKLQRMLLERGLVEGITAHHPGKYVPPTHKTGSKPIDGIFITPGITVLNAGFLAHSDGVAVTGADHRCVWMDIDLDAILGKAMPAPHRFPARRVKCNDPRIVNRFNKAYEEFLAYHGLHEKVFDLELEAEYPLSRPQQQLYEQLDRMRAQGILAADRKCRKLCMGGVPWSPQLKRHMALVRFWGEYFKKRKGVRVKSRYLQRLAKKADVKEHLSDLNGIPLAEIKARAREVFNQYKEFRKKAASARKDWLDQVAAAMAERGNTTKETILKQLKERERQRAAARRVRFALGRTRSGGISMVVAPNADGDWVEMTERVDIEKGCLWENERRFRQAMYTPFMKEPLQSLVGYLGTGEAAEAILEGTFEPPPRCGSNHSQIYQAT